MFLAINNRCKLDVCKFALGCLFNFMMVLTCKCFDKAFKESNLDFSADPETGVAFYGAKVVPSFWANLRP